MSDIDQNLDTLIERSYSTDVPFLLKLRESLKRKINESDNSRDVADLARVNAMLRDAMSNRDGMKNFSDVQQVLIYLQANGRKLSQSQLYKDIKRGYLRRQPDKSFRQRDVDFYATMLPLVSMPENKADESTDLAQEKMREDIAKAREQRLSIKQDREIKANKYILREDVALELASRAAALGLAMRSVFRIMSPDWIRLVGGDVNKAEELAAEFEKNFDIVLHEYSKPMEFKTEFFPDENTSKSENVAGDETSGDGENGA